MVARHRRRCPIADRCNNGPRRSCLRLRTQVVAVVALLAGLASPARALDPSKGLAECTVQAWHVRDGLPGAWVRSLAQTPDGYLWIATAAGLGRHDGAQVTAVPADGPLA